MLAIEFDAAEDLDLVHDHLERKGYDIEVQVAPVRRILVPGFDDGPNLGQVTLDYVTDHGGTVISDTELAIE